MILPRSSRAFSLPPMPSHWGPDWTWYALRVVPGRELALEARLRELDHFSFVPVKHVLLKPRAARAKRRVLAARAQYPGYVMIGIPPGFVASWDILDLDGIIGVVGRAGEPVPMREATMIAMLAGTRRPIAYINGHKGKRRNNGRRAAEIISGPYQGRQVRVVELLDDDPEIFELAKPRKSV